ncbi:MAG TPA: PqqD family protein [Vicinamibacteria bacterium]
MKPRARRDGLLIRELADELLVYDQADHRAHCLNRTAATVFRHADGTRTTAEIARLLAPGEPDGEPAVAEALARLTEAGLLESRPPLESASRREALRRVGLGAAVLLPAVVSIVAPAPAEAAATCIYIAYGGDCTGKSGTPCSCLGSPGSVCAGTCLPTDVCSDC